MYARRNPCGSQREPNSAPPHAVGYKKDARRQGLHGNCSGREILAEKAGWHSFSDFHQTQIGSSVLHSRIQAYVRRQKLGIPVQHLNTLILNYQRNASDANMGRRGYSLKTPSAAALPTVAPASLIRFQLQFLRLSTPRMPSLQDRFEP